MLDVKELILIAVTDGLPCFCDRCGQCSDEDDHHRHPSVLPIPGPGCPAGCKYMLHLLKEIGQGDFQRTGHVIWHIGYNYFEHILNIVRNTLGFFGTLKKNELHIHDSITVEKLQKTILV